MAVPQKNHSYLLCLKAEHELRLQESAPSRKSGEKSSFYLQRWGVNMKMILHKQTLLK